MTATLPHTPPDMEADEVESDCDGPERLLDAWLGELDTLTGGLDQPVQLRQPSSADLNTPRIDSYRFSMANLEDSQDVDLDAILGELCALESQCDEAIAEGNAGGLGVAGKRTSAPVHGAPGLGSAGQPLGLGMTITSHSRSNSDGHRDFMCKTSSVRTDSPDNDSAFSDNVSMLSSESSASSGGSGGSGGQNNACLAPSPTQMDAAKAEKIRIALEKMREAAVQKLFIKVFTSDGSAKSLLVDEKMTVGHVTRLLADKNHVTLEPKWAVLEHLPDLHMERVYEDHELLVDNLMMWTRDSKNKLLFLERAEERTRLFLQPEAFLLGKQEHADFDDHARALLLEEFFASSGVGVPVGVPEVEGPLYIKSDSKKGWKKHQCVLRASGLYYYPKEKAKVSSRDLVCLATFDVNQVYYGVGWKKKHKAPTEHCFAIKHPKLQQPKSAKHIKFLCADDADTLHRWVVGIRVAKYGRQLQENYRSLSEELAQEELDRLAKARSCSVASIHVSSMLSPGLNGIVPSSGASSSSSSGCLSDAGRSSSTEQDHDLDVRSMGGFECEFPSGTIKRKPSAIPSLPLTSTTRQIIENGEDENAGGGTLTRRLSRRRSTMADADGASIGSSGSNSSTLKRHTTYSACRGSPSQASPAASPSHASPTQPLEAATPVAMSPSTLTPSASPASPVPSLGLGAAPHSPVLYASVTYASLPVVPQGPIPNSGHVPGDEHDGSGSDMESLPLPPPPELSQSTLSLDSLPPPPAPGELYNGELSGSSLSLASLPPPPPSPPPPAPAKKISFQLPPRSCSPEEVQYDQPRLQYSSMQYDSMPSMPPEMPELPPHPILQAKSVLRNGTNGHGPIYGHTGSMPHQNGHKKISFNLGEEGIVNGGRNCDDRKTASLGHQKRITFKLPSPSDERPPPPMRVPPVPAFNGEAPPLLARKPPPPRRSENTRLSSGPLPEPEPDFLKDLQRVMQRKWQVAQKCKQEPTTTPHEVLGFRDPPPPVADYKETNVSNWVQEHYGTSEDELDNVYENVLNRLPELSCDTRTVAQYAMPAPVPNQQSAIALAAAKKRPPPPPPKRSETTHLTTYSPQRMH